MTVVEGAGGSWQRRGRHRTPPTAPWKTLRVSHKLPPAVTSERGLNASRRTGMTCAQVTV